MNRLRRLIAAIRHRLDRARIRGWFELDILRGDGSREHHEFRNAVHNAGLAWLTDKLSGGVATDIEYLAAGTAADALDYTDTALQGTELCRAAGTPSQATTTIADDTYQVTHEFAAGTGTGTWEEMAVLDASSDGVMFARALTSTKVKNAADSFTLTYKCKFARA